MCCLKELGLNKYSTIVQYSSTHCRFLLLNDAVNDSQSQIYLFMYLHRSVCLLSISLVLHSETKPTHHNQHD